MYGGPEGHLRLNISRLIVTAKRLHIGGLHPECPTLMGHCGFPKFNISNFLGH